MLLYHFTALEYLEAILREGLTKGEAPLSQTEVLNAINLTTSKHTDGHGLGQARDLTAAERRISGVAKGKPARWADKRAVRLTVRVPANDRNLMPWRKFRCRLAPEWRDILESGDGHRWKTWYLYWGVIPPEWIAETVVDEDRLRAGIESGEISIGGAGIE